MIPPVVLEPKPDELVLDIEANRFLQAMVRTIVGTLVEVGRGRLPPEAVSEILAARDRRRAGPTAPARGLCLVKVYLDEEEYRADAAIPRAGPEAAADILPLRSL